MPFTLWPLMPVIIPYWAGQFYRINLDLPCSFARWILQSELYIADNEFLLCDNANRMTSWFWGPLQRTPLRYNRQQVSIHYWASQFHLLICWHAIFWNNYENVHWLKLCELFIWMFLISFGLQTTEFLLQCIETLCGQSSHV